VKSEKEADLTKKYYKAKDVVVVVVVVVVVALYICIVQINK